MFDLALYPNAINPGCGMQTGTDCLALHAAGFLAAGERLPVGRGALHGSSETCSAHRHGFHAWLQPQYLFPNFGLRACLSRVGSVPTCKILCPWLQPRYLFPSFGLRACLSRVGSVPTCKILYPQCLMAGILGCRRCGVRRARRICAPRSRGWRLRCRAASSRHCSAAPPAAQRQPLRLHPCTLRLHRRPLCAATQRLAQVQGGHQRAARTLRFRRRPGLRSAAHAAQGGPAAARLRAAILTSLTLPAAPR